MKNICTVMTPAYNRKEQLFDLFQSLKNQTCMSFEWLIVDDGSTDQTELFIKSLLSGEYGFPVRYYKTENGGKHRAVNFALDHAAGKYFFIVDSDDRLPKNAIETVLKMFKSIENSDGFAGVAGLRKHIFSDEIHGTTFKGTYIDCLYSERTKYNISGDKAEIYYTEVLRQNRFPEFEGEKFLSEGILWNRISEQGKLIRWFNEPIYECEYRTDGLTNNIYANFASSPKGFALYVKDLIKYDNLSLTRKSYYYGIYYCLVKNMTVSEMKRLFHIGNIQLAYGVILAEATMKVKNLAGKAKNSIAFSVEHQNH